jgi:hypothetical protein
MSVFTKFESFLASAGKFFVKGLDFAVKEAPAASALAALIYPQSLAVSPAIVAALNLTQASVISIEQKYAASGAATGTGSQKAAEVLSLAGPAVTHLLTSAGVPAVNDAYVSNLITAIAGVLNAKAPLADVVAK